MFSILHFAIISGSSSLRYSFSSDLLFLTVTSLQPNDTGVYSLLARNPAGTSSDSAHLHVGG